MDLNQPEKPISELITPVEDNREVPQVVPEQKKSKAFVIIVSILLFLILCVGGYYVYTQYFVEEEVEQVTEEEETEVSKDTITMQLEEDKTLEIKHSLLTEGYYEDFGLVQESLFSKKWKTNMGPSADYTFEYFLNEEAMTESYAGDTVTYPLEKVTIDGIDYNYILREDSLDEDGNGTGIVYKWLPKVEVKDYQASKILRYYNALDLDSEFSEESTVYAQLCLFDLNQIDTNIFGYIIFGGSSANDTDYCDVLNDLDVFEIRVY